jgi:hypothetical protein
VALGKHTSLLTVALAAFPTPSPPALLQPSIENKPSLPLDRYLVSSRRDLARVPCKSHCLPPERAPTLILNHLHPCTSLCAPTHPRTLAVAASTASILNTLQLSSEPCETAYITIASFPLLHPSHSLVDCRAIHHHGELSVQMVSNPSSLELPVVALDGDFAHPTANQCDPKL